MNEKNKKKKDYFQALLLETGAFTFKIEDGNVKNYVGKQQPSSYQYCGETSDVGLV